MVYVTIFKKLKMYGIGVTTLGGKRMELRAMKTINVVAKVRPHPPGKNLNAHLECLSDNYKTWRYLKHHFKTNQTLLESPQ